MKRAPAVGSNEGAKRARGQRVGRGGEIAERRRRRRADEEGASGREQRGREALGAAAHDLHVLGGDLRAGGDGSRDFFEKEDPAAATQGRSYHLQRNVLFERPDLQRDFTLNGGRETPRVREQKTRGVRVVLGLRE